MRSFSLVAAGTVALAGLVGAAVAACSSDPATSSGGDATAACAKYFDSLSKRSADCAAQRGTSTTGDFTPDNRDAFMKQCGLSLGAPGTGISPGFLTSCVAELDKQPAGCLTGSLEDVTACTPPAGTLADGAPCAGSEQCASGACGNKGGASAGDGGAADGGSSSAASFCGTCTPTLPEGADCTASGSRCGRNLSCLSGKCAKRPAPLPEGGTCAFKSGTQTTVLTCQSGLTCDVKLVGTELSGTCKKEPVKGEACTTRCKTPFICATGTCADPVAEGGDCPKGTECQASLYCDATAKKCKAYTVAAAGGACGTPGVKCATNLACVVGAGGSTCMAKIAAGGACAVDTGAPCTAYTSCVAGTCQYEDPATCK